MKSIQAFLQRHALFAGVLLMFLFTWPIDLAKSGVLPIQLPFAVYITLGWGFGYAALIMTGLTQGRREVVNLLKRFLIWRVGWKWYLAALLLSPGLATLAVGLNAAATRTPADFDAVFAHQIFGPGTDLIPFIIPFFLFDAITNGEEIGWRGYVLPRLQAKHSALAASLITGLIWSFWHLPKFLGPEKNTPFPLFVIGTTAAAVLYTWLFNNTEGSLLLVTLFHAASNTAGVFLPIANTAAGGNLGAASFYVFLEVIAAAVVVYAAGAARLSRKEPKQIQRSTAHKEAVL